MDKPKFQLLTEFNTPFSTYRKFQIHATGDFNNDGELDLIVNTPFDGDLKNYILLSDGSSGFEKPSESKSLSSNNGITIVEDFNGDGKLDLAMARHISTKPYGGYTTYNDVAFFYGDGQGGFNEPYSISLSISGSDYPFSIASGDFNSNGRTDLIVTTRDYQGRFLPLNVIWDHARKEHFPHRVSPDLDKVISAGDFNGDNLADLLSNGRIYLHTQNGFTLLKDANNEFNAFAADDFNNDGKLDVVSFSKSSVNGTRYFAINLLLGDGSGAFGKPSTLYFDNNDTSIGYFSGGRTCYFADDFNGDGKKDIALKIDTQSYNSSYSGVNVNSKIIVFSGDDNGGFSKPEIVYSFPEGGDHFFVTGDFNGDFRPDILTNDFSMLLNVTKSNRPPTGLVVLSGLPTQGEILIASNSLADLDGLGIVSYQWLRDSYPISFANQSTYKLSPLDSGKNINLYATYTDLQGFAEKIYGKWGTPIQKSNFVNPKENYSLAGTMKNEKISALAGNDTLIGGLGADKLTGGKGADTFTFTSIDDSGITAKTRDTITDFKHNEGDQIDLSLIDADSNLADDQAFIFIGSEVFSAAGQIRFDAKTHILYGSTNADNSPAFSILLSGVKSLVTADDFVL